MKWKEFRFLRAQTTIHLAVLQEVEGVSGLCFADCKQKEPSKAAQDDGAAKKLWEMTCFCTVACTVIINNW